MTTLSALISLLTLVLAQDGGALTTVQDIVNLVGPRTVALRVERAVSDERPQFGPEFRKRLEELGPAERENLAAYFHRPDGPVTGFLIDDEGHILTSSYNLDGEIGEVKAILEGGKTVPATFVARDRVSDLALLKIDRRHLNGVELPKLEWAIADDYAVGHMVISIGRSPTPRSPTVTMGIISAPARQYGRVFQTDAALNYGNVGGPLVSLEGRVLGVAAYVGHSYPLWGMNSGVGFGIRANAVLAALPYLKSGYSLEGPAFLGVYADLKTAENVSGAPIERTVQGLSAAKGGIEGKDVIVEFNGEPVRDFGHLRELIFWKRPGDRVPVRVRRGETSVELEVILGIRPKNL